MPSSKTLRQRARVKRQGIFVAFDPKGKERKRGDKPNLTGPSKASKKRGKSDKSKRRSQLDRAIEGQSTDSNQ